MSRIAVPRPLPRFAFRQILFVAAMVVLVALAARYMLTDLMVVQVGDPDEGVYLGAARLLNYGHVYAEFFFDQFWLFAEILAVALRVFGDTLATGRLVVVGFSVMGLAAATLLAKQLGARWFALLAIPFGIVNHYYLAQSRVTMTDVPGIATMLWAVVAAIAFYQSKQRRWLVLCAVALTASLLIKPLSIGFVLPIGYAIVAPRVTRDDGRLRLDWMALVWDGVVFFGTALLVAFPFVDLFDLRGEFERTVGFHWDEKSWYAPAEDLRFNGLISFAAENRMWLGLSALGVVAAARRKLGLAVMLVAGEIVSALVLVQLPPWRHHYALLALLMTTFAAIGVGEGILVCVRMVRELWVSFLRTGIFGGVDAVPRAVEPRQFLLEALLILFALGAGVWVHDLPQLARYNAAVMGERTHDGTAVINYLKKHMEPGDFVISDSPIVVYLAGCLLPPSAVNLPYESTFRFAAESRARMSESIANYPVKAIVVTADYKRNPELMEWIESNFPLEDTVGGGGSNMVFARVFLPDNPLTHMEPPKPGGNALPAEPTRTP